MTHEAALREDRLHVSAELDLGRLLRASGEEEDGEELNHREAAVKGR